MSETNLTSMGKDYLMAEIIGFGEDRIEDRFIVARLQEMGLHPGLSLTWMGRAPFNGPFLFQFGSTVLALREEEAKCVLIKKAQR